MRCRGKAGDAFAPELPVRLPPLKSLPAHVEAIAELSQRPPTPAVLTRGRGLAALWWGWARRVGAGGQDGQSRAQSSPGSVRGHTGQGFFFAPS